MPTQWHIARDGAELGTATSDELRLMVHTGKLLASDQMRDIDWLETAMGGPRVALRVES
jgi:hypothetical protein